MFFWGFLSKLIRLLLKVTKVTSGHKNRQKWPKQHNKLFFLPEVQKKASAEGQSPPQELEVGPRSGPYLLVLFIWLPQNMFLTQSAETHKQSYQSTTESEEAMAH